MDGAHFNLLTNDNKNHKDNKDLDEKRFYINKIYFDIMETLYEEKTYKELLSFIFSALEYTKKKFDKFIPHNHTKLNKTLTKYSFYGAISLEGRQVILLTIFIIYAKCQDDKTRDKYIEDICKADYFKEYKNLMRSIYLVLDNKEIMVLLDNNWEIDIKLKDDFIKSINKKINKNFINQCYPKPQLNK